MTLAAFLPLAIGCTSNEYVIPHEELARLAAMPPPQRGARVRVVQDLGDRRSEPVQMAVAPPPPQFVTDEETAGDDGEEVDVQIDLSGGGQRPRRHGLR